MPLTPEAEARRVENIKLGIARSKANDPDKYRRAGAMGGKRRTRGYFGYLKDTDPEKFKKLQKAAVSKATATRIKRKSSKS